MATMKIKALKGFTGSNINMFLGEVREVADDDPNIEEYTALMSEGFIANYVQNDLPSISGSDNGKVLTVVEGNWAVADSAVELPKVTSSDNGKLLTVVSGHWAKANAVTELPAVTAEDNGAVLTVVEGDWAVENVPTELPAVTAEDNGAVLTVVDGAWDTGAVPSPAQD